MYFSSYAAHCTMQTSMYNEAPVKVSEMKKFPEVVTILSTQSSHCPINKGTIYAYFRSFGQLPFE